MSRDMDMTEDELKAALAACNDTLIDKLYDTIRDMEFRLDFYKKRVELLQAVQKEMRDPERTVVCDIIANGALLRGGGRRYGDMANFVSELLAEEEVTP